MQDTENTQEMNDPLAVLELKYTETQRRNAVRKCTGADLKRLAETCWCREAGTESSAVGDMVVKENCMAGV